MQYPVQGIDNLMLIGFIECGIHRQTYCLFVILLCVWTVTRIKAQLLVIWLPINRDVVEVDMNISRPQMLINLSLAYTPFILFDSDWVKMVT